MPLVAHPIDMSAYHARLAALGPGAVNHALAAIGTAARDKWMRLAASGLNRTYLTYVNGLQELTQDPRSGGVTIALVGMLPNMVENGMDERDLHETLLGPNVPVVPPGQRGKHLSKSGTFYRSIPFRFQTPGTLGSMAPVMGASHGPDRARAIGRTIHRLAKELSATTSEFTASHAGAAFGLGLGRIPGAAVGSRFGLAERRWGGRIAADLAEHIAPILANRVTGKEHTTSLYSGMYRFQKTYEKATQSTYGTFRTISTAPSSQSKWIRPRTSGKFYGLKVAQEMAPLARQILVGLFEGMANL